MKPVYIVLFAFYALMVAALWQLRPIPTGLTANTNAATPVDVNDPVVEFVIGDYSTVRFDVNVGDPPYDITYDITNDIVDGDYVYIDDYGTSHLLYCRIEGNEYTVGTDSNNMPVLRPVKEPNETAYAWWITDPNELTSIADPNSFMGTDIVEDDWVSSEPYDTMMAKLDEIERKIDRLYDTNTLRAVNAVNDYLDGDDF
jgi:hypothetical protein